LYFINVTANGLDSGQVRIFKYQNGSWTQVGNDILGDGEEDYNGYSVSLSSDGLTVAIGAPVNGTYSGQVKIFKYQNDNDSWTQLGGDILGDAAYDQSGYSVSLSDDGSTVAIGAIGKDDIDNNKYDIGQVRIFKYQNGSWTQVGNILGDTASDQSGWSVSLSDDGSTVAIGAIWNDGSNDNSDIGQVKIFKYQNDSWTQLGDDILGDTAYDQSGWSVSLSGDGSTVAIGAVGKDGSNDNYDIGQVKIFKYQNDNDRWTKLGVDILGDTENAQSGWSVSLSGDGSTVAIGAYLNGDNGVDSGQVKIFKFK
jgi:hypothetical protein